MDLMLTVVGSGTKRERISCGALFFYNGRHVTPRGCRWSVKQDHQFLTKISTYWNTNTKEKRRALNCNCLGLIHELIKFMYQRLWIVFSFTQTDTHTNTHTHSQKRMCTRARVAQFAGAVECTDCISAARSLHSNECPRYDTKQSEGKVPVLLELCGMRSTPLLPSLPGSLWPRVVAPERVLIKD